MPRPFYQSTLKLTQASLAALLLVAMSGCTSRSDDGDVITITFALWVPVSIILGSIAAAFGGYVFRETRYGWGVAIVAVIFGVLFGPGMFLDKVVVDKQGFRLRTGLPFLASEREVKFGEIATMTITKETHGVGRRRRTNYDLHCTKKSGGELVVPLGDLMKNGGLDAVLERASEQNIRIFDTTSD